MCIFITPDLLTFASKVTYRIYVSQVHLNSHAITYNKVEIPVIKRSFFEVGLYFFSALKPIFVFLCLLSTLHREIAIQIGCMHYKIILEAIILSWFFWGGGGNFVVMVCLT